jgi:hypothetical protein
MPIFMTGCNCEIGQFLATPPQTDMDTGIAMSLETMPPMPAMVASSLAPWLA